MAQQENHQQLVERVIEQIREDIHFHEHEALEELLGFIPVQYLDGYLPEEEWKYFKNLQEKSEEDVIKVSDLVKFLEYEEGYTVDPKTQKRIRTKLQELGIWTEK